MAPRVLVPLLVAVTTAVAVAPAAGAAPSPAPTTPAPATSTATDPAAQAPGGTVAPAADAADHLPDGTVVEEVPVTVAPAASSDAGAEQVAPLRLQDVPDEGVVADDVADGRVLTGPVALDGVQTVGVTWDAGGVDPADVRLRTLTDGAWSDWEPVPLADDAPDRGTADAERAVRAGTDPVWVGDDAEAVEVSLPADAPAPDGMALVLVGSPEVDTTPVAATGTADADLAALAEAGLPARRVISRAEWGAPAQVCTPSVASTVTHVVLHHTAGSNAYATVGQAMQQLRNDALFHINGRGWCDLGYNFVVDKWGNVYEGRAGSAQAAVVGVHAGGFNTSSVGISMLGTYTTTTPSPAVEDAVAWVAASRLRAYHRDPAGTVTITTAGGQNSSVPPGTTITLPRIFGHRDVAYTACPGVGGYSTLPGVRARAREYVTPSFVDAGVTASSVRVGGQLTVRARVLGAVPWRVEIRDARTNVLVGGGSGTAGHGGTASLTWNADDTTRTSVGPGTYRVTLSSSDSRVLPWHTTVEVTGSLPAPPSVAPVALTGDLRFVPITPARVLDTRPGAKSLGEAGRVDVVVAGVKGVPSSARAVALNVTAVSPSRTTFVQAWPAGGRPPTASVLNADAGRSAAASGVVVGVGGEGKVSLLNNAGSTHLVVDVTGYYTTAGSGGFEPLAEAARVLDSRTGGGAAMTNGVRRTVKVAGTRGVPADATAVVVNATSVVSRGNGYVAVVPSGASVTATSTVNHLPGADVANRTTVALARGSLDVAVVGADAHVVLDVVGWFGPGGDGRFTPVQPVRAFDTRVSGPAVGAGQTRTLPVRSPAVLPERARTAVMTLTATRQTSGATYVTAWPTGSARPATSDMNTGRRDQANLVVVPLGRDGAVDLYNDQGSTHLVGDVYGWFD
ncbi:N-acetylmuramoyl-L-alanine amidase [Cellulomonas carbonis]|uniref:N-acetylmuramoyl-L-alanine amidase n=1 Tax=Cellulomonas carbonis T26 TaxID=947969 RepID=A0A0A0BNG4_9CELL|nr:N-acetylmuramoyl-L-alanine amidase [Cellulomonas carbonis]KGM09192.1 N-acetylmuramoyl-L-alanine amidase [Cellulomonas carbonis T26]GGC11153.1 hypothetical protein GCM10010972_25640 [Cellulomonas carbonis]